MKCPPLIFLIFLMGCDPTPKDPIDALMEEISLPRSYESYGCIPIRQPPSATPEFLLEQLAADGRLAGAGIANYTNLEVRSTQTKLRREDREMLHYHESLGRWRPESYTAVLLGTDAGLKILLLRHVGTNSGVDQGWFWRVYATR